MKQAIYADQVRRCATYRDLMETMVEVCDVRGVDAAVVAELRAMAATKNLHDPRRDAAADAAAAAAAPPPPAGLFARLWGK